MIRVPRRIASDRRFWAWIAIEFGREYIKHRFSDGEGSAICRPELEPTPSAATGT